MKKSVTFMHWPSFSFAMLAVWCLAACSGSQEKPTEGNKQPVEAKPAAGQGQSGQGNANPGETTKVFDLNHDNKPDVWAYYSQMSDPADMAATKESLVRKEWDFNFDGKVDIRRFFNFKGETVKDQLDLDFDGRFDVTSYYQNGSKVKQEYDFNFDSKPDYWKFYEKNQIARTERDRDFNGRVDRWEYYAAGKLDRIGLDEDGDGQINRWIQNEE